MSDFYITDNEKIILLQTARTAINSKLYNIDADYKTGTGTLLQSCGAFVTLHIGNKLRGCIGYMTGIKPIIEAVKELAVSSAFNDRRFPPLEKGEFEKIDIEISVLSPLKPVNSINEIEIGKHGIYLRKGFNTGVLLPQVAVEQNWDLNTFLTHTCYKAGLPGDAWQDGNADISIFSSVIFSEKEMKLGKN